MKKIKSFDRIGWIGLGKMGAPMCKELITAGYLVKVHDRDTVREQVLTDFGAASALNPCELIRRTEFVIVMVSGDEASEELFHGNSGLLTAGVSGKTIIHMGSISPAVSRALELLCGEQGIGYLEAPVMGSSSMAGNADLIIMAGGNQECFEKSKPILESLGRIAVYTGKGGSANTSASIINELFKLYAQGIIEALSSGESRGIKTETLMMLINQSVLNGSLLKSEITALQQKSKTQTKLINHLPSN